MKKSLDAESISSGIKQAKENSERFNNVIPNVELCGSVVVYRTSVATVEIDSLDEIVLTILVKFLFVPIWFVKKMYNYEIEVFSDEDIKDKINSWVSIGICWKQSDVTGWYLRPTHALFNLFGEPIPDYSDIPFNTLRHAICEEKVMFEIMFGISRICKENFILPRQSLLGINGNLSGTNVIAENDFRNPSLYNDGYYKILMDKENQINEGIKRGDPVTLELQDFGLFPIVKKIDNKGSVRSDFKFLYPDLAIPCIRDKDGSPRSIAIELELTNKYNYSEIIKTYKNNTKYGTVYYFCNTPSIKNSIISSFEEEGGTGSCKMKLIPFSVPSPEI